MINFRNYMMRAGAAIVLASLLSGCHGSGLPTYPDNAWIPSFFLLSREQIAKRFQPLPTSPLQLIRVTESHWADSYMATHLRGHNYMIGDNRQVFEVDYAFRKGKNWDRSTRSEIVDAQTGAVLEATAFGLSPATSPQAIWNRKHHIHARPSYM